MGIAEGLSYLHSKKVVHGDLRGVRLPWSHRTFRWLRYLQANVLVDINDEGNPVPRISDFGMSQLIQETDKTVTNDWNQGGRYSPPEYVDYGTGSNLSYAGPKNPTPQGDVWMYSMTLLVCFSFTLRRIYVHSVASTRNCTLVNRRIGAWLITKRPLRWRAKKWPTLVNPNTCLSRLMILL